MIINVRERFSERTACLYTGSNYEECKTFLGNTGVERQVNYKDNAAPSCLVIRDGNGIYRVYAGEWIVRLKDGRLRILSQPNFDAQYEVIL